MPLRNGHICVLTAIMFLVSAAQAQQQPDPDSRGNNVTGSGTTNTIPVWTGTNSIGNSVMFQTGGNLGVGTTTPGSKLDVAGDVNFSGVLRYQGNTVLRFPIGTNNPIGNNTALGVGALQSSSGGIYNTAVGYNALSLNSSGEFNTAIGEGSLSGRSGFITSPLEQAH